MNEKETEIDNFTVVARFYCPKGKNGHYVDLPISTLELSKLDRTGDLGDIIQICRKHNLKMSLTSLRRPGEIVALDN